MAKVLVVYASRYGATEEIAEVLAEELGAQGAEAQACPVEEAGDLAGYDAVVVGSAVYHGRWLDEARQFVNLRREDLAARPTWLFSSGPIGGTANAEADLARKCGLDTPVPGRLSSVAQRVGVRGHATFGGKIGEGATGMLARWMPRGDWRDMDQVRAWAERIRGGLPTA